MWTLWLLLSTTQSISGLGVLVSKGAMLSWGNTKIVHWIQSKTTTWPFWALHSTEPTGKERDYYTGCSDWSELLKGIRLLVYNEDTEHHV